MRKLLLVALIAMAAALVPTAQSDAQGVGAGDCLHSVVVGDRCISVDDAASLCDGASCVTFVEESVDVCPDGTVELSAGAGAGEICELIEAASQADPDCPDGSRGDAGACYIYLATGVDGCIAPSVLDLTGNCRRVVIDAQGYYYCEGDEQQLLGRDCRTFIEKVPSPCPGTSTRFDGACWNISGLVPPEACVGHPEPGTAELASGLCRVPLAIPTGAASCTGDAVYRNLPSYVLLSAAGTAQGQGPLEDACIDPSASVGLSVRYCFFPLDDYSWSTYGDPVECGRFEDPTTVTCPAGYTIDDFSAGLCAQNQPPVGGSCPDGATPFAGGCIVTTEFTTFECPAGTERFGALAACITYRPYQGAANCGYTDALLMVSGVLELGLNYGCFPHLGPQPDICNGLGTIADCYEIREPATVNCASVTGCVEVGTCALGAGSFGDVPAAEYFRDAVDWAACAGVTAGTSDAVFSPEATVSRAQMATFLWRFAGEPAGGSHPFVDVAATAYYADAVAWLAASGITAGTSDTTFSPDAPVTRAQMATFLWRFVGEPTGFTHPFADVVPGEFYEDGVAWMAGTGVTTGTSDTTFSPEDSLTRGQAVTFLHRTMLLPD